MKIDAPDLERKLQKLVNAQNSKSRIKLSVVPGSKSLSAQIHIVTKDISIKLPSNWDPAQYERIKQYSEKMRIPDPRRNILDDIAFHEVGHDRLRNDAKGLGCPVDIQGKEVCIDAVTKEMLSAGRFSQGGALYLQNLISDVINNLNCTNYSKFNGVSLFFAEQGEINKGKFSPLYEAFVKLNMQLWGTKKQKQLLGQYYENSEKVDDVIRKCIDEVGLSGSKKENLRILFNRKQWSTIFSGFAKHLVELMDISSPESLPGSGGEGYEVPDKFDDSGEFDPDKIDDPMMKRVLDKDNMRRSMQRRNEEGDDAPSFLKDWRALDYLYQAIAGEILIKAETPKKGEALPISPIGARGFDHEKDDFEKLLFGRILIGTDGKPLLAVPQSYVEKTQKYKKTIKSYPELNIAVLDTSGSMEEAANTRGKGRTNIIPWGDNCKYHYAVLSYYGVEKAMHKMGVATRTRYSLITFSSKTTSTVNKAYDERHEIKQRILQPVMGGSTNIDISILEKHTREPQSVLMTISDGEIFNWDSIKETFKNIISDKFYVHFQIGSDSNATKDIEKWGARVVRISDASQMPRQAIEIAQKFYLSCAAGDLR